MKISLLGGRTYLLCVMTMLLCSCTCPRPILRTQMTAETQQQCLLPFSGSPCRYIHAIEAVLPGRVQLTVIGITIIDPAADKIRAAIITLEGLVLFDASAAGENVTIHRALPPFDGREFALHLMQDVRFIFVPPAGTHISSGMIDNGATICRYEGAGGMTVDVIVHRDQTWEIEQYKGCRKPLRRVSGHALKNGVPGIIELSTHKPRTYSLRLELISVEPVSSGEIQ